MNKIRCLIVDDEPPAIELLQKYASMIEQLEVIGTCQSAVKAFDFVDKLAIDLMFLDIRMPMLNGLDLIKSLKKPPPIILTTAYREYAIESYDLDIIDYLLKPIAFDRFLKAVDRYRSKNTVEPSQNQKPNQQVQHIFFNVNRTQHKVDLEEILYIESLKDYVRIHMVRKESLVVKGNLGTIMRKISNDRFIRIHRSYAIAVDKVKSYNQSEIYIDGNKLPVGPTYKDTLSSYYEDDTDLRK